ncbi:alpha/beta fold hydrolase [Streptomyces sp. NPDC089919]|uniref:alpha/beta fold hydrolase n=1 Tax=Streptomyces sp. NPDC089919 TaxID=3155188 RepID=UPI0034237725
MNITSLTAAALAVTGLVALTGPGGAPSGGRPDPAADRPTGRLVWGTCGREDIQEGVECGRLTVPVDWSRPAGQQVALRAYRMKATGGPGRGTILNFPSGPGETGDIAFATLRDRLPRYDLVALDPRGVGESAPLRCATDRILKIPLVPPTGQRAFEELAAGQRAFWSSCRTSPAAVKGHLDAVSNARDAEALRAALKLDRVNLYGMSYGTLLAERYLGLFGRQVNGAVLEGVMDPARSRRSFVTSAAAASEAVHDRFARWCARNKECVLHGKDLDATLRTAQRQADRGRVPGTAFGRPWSAAAVVQYVETATGNADFAGAARGLAALARGANPDPDDGGGDQPVPKALPYADPVVCSDFDLSVRDRASAAGDLEAARRAAPHLGYSTNAAQYTSICLNGPAPAKGSGTPVVSRSAHPVMLLSNTLDPSTPIAWADAVQRRLGPDTLHVRTDKVGHGGGLDVPDTRRRVAAYLDRLNRA